MAKNKRGKPQQWTDDQLQKIALDIRYKLPNGKLTALLLENETGIGRNTWSRRMKDFINQLNTSVYIPSLKQGGIITIPTVEELFANYEDNKIELKNEIAKLFNIINDLYNNAKQIEPLKISLTKLQNELDDTKEKLKQTTEQKLHFETLYNQIVTESYFPHLYGRSEKLKAVNIKSQVIPLPKKSNEVLDLSNPTQIFNKDIKEIKTLEENNAVLEKLKIKFNLNL